MVNDLRVLGLASLVPDMRQKLRPTNDDTSSELEFVSWGTNALVMRHKFVSAVLEGSAVLGALLPLYF